MSDGQVGLSGPQRKVCGVSPGDPIDVTPAETSNYQPTASVSLALDFVTKKKGASSEVDAQKLSAYILRNFAGQVLSVEQGFIFEFVGAKYMAKVKSIDVKQGTDDVVDARQGLLMPEGETEIFYAKDSNPSIAIKGGRAKKASLIKKAINMSSLGIGGLDDQFGEIFRRAFTSRVFPSDVIEKMGIKHVKGVLLFGPPGTGKTLIARKIGEMLDSKEPKIVNGPEILNKFVGESEQKIRDLFVDAEEEYEASGEDSELHLIIFDEIDAICKQRGSGKDSTGVQDTVVNQLLSKIDGVNAINNIMVIGM